MENKTQDSTISIGLLADPGIADQMATDVCQWLAKQDFGAPGTEIESQVLGTSLTLSADGAIPLIETARRIREQQSWDLVICITNLPRHPNDSPVVVDVALDERAALISLPALGFFRVRRQLRQVVDWSVKTMLSDSAENPPLRTRRLESGHEEIQISMGYGSAKGMVRLLNGMVRDNRPWRLVPSLSASLAAALAGGAFGVFYSNLWQLASSMSPLRLLLTSLAAVGIYVGWLIVNHNMWEDRNASRRRVFADLYNASTVATLTLGTAAMYTLLFVLILVGSLIIVPPAFLEAQIEQSPNFTTYLSLAWLASSLGMFAGAVGSSVESATDVRDAAYSKRVVQRLQTQQAARSNAAR